MAVLVHPGSELIREPRLLVPKMAPLGQVRVNLQDPLASAIRGFFLVTSGGWVELLTGRRQITNTGSVVGTPFGLAMDYDAGERSAFSNYSGWYLSSAMTVIAAVTIDALADYTAICAFQDSISTTGWEFRLGSGSNDSFLLMHRGNASSFNQMNGGENRLTAGEPFVVVGASYPTAEIGSSSGARLYAKGIGQAAGDGTGTATGDQTNATTETFRIGTRQDNFTKINGRIHFIALWSRMLSGAEHAAMALSPFDLLIPA